MEDITIIVNPPDVTDVTVKVGYSTEQLDKAVDDAEAATAVALNALTSVQTATTNANTAAANADNAAIATLPTPSDQTFTII